MQEPQSRVSPRTEILGNLLPFLSGFRASIEDYASQGYAPVKSKTPIQELISPSEADLFKTCRYSPRMNP